MIRRFRKPLVFLSLLGAAVGVPYAGSNNVGTTLGQAWRSLGGSSASPAAGSPDEIERQLIAPPAGGDPVPPLVTRPDAAPLEGMPVVELAEVLRFDVTPAWVYQRWARKTTALTDLDYHGVRVPLVTGMAVDDLAGSLSYYFNYRGELDRIVFRGRTGDPQRLVALVTQRFGFIPQRPANAAEQLYQVRWNNRPMSELRIRPAGVLWASAPHANFEVELDLQRPGIGRYLHKPTPELSKRTGDAHGG